MIFNFLHHTMKCNGLIISLLITTSVLNAQARLAQVELDSTVCVIGGQVNMYITAQNDEGDILFPSFNDTLNSDIEVLSGPVIDTLNENNSKKIKATYTLTCFEDSLYSIAQLPVVMQQDTVWTNPVSIRFIQPFEIDTTKLALFDIKPPIAPPFYWKGYALAAALILCIIGLLVAIWLLFRKFFVKDVVIEKIPPQVRRRNAYDVAIGELNRIKDEKRWQQQGQQKIYHSEVTDALRQYIDDLYDIGCMEMPSSEILAHMKTLLKNNSEAYSELNSILNIADLVKFAKYNALPDENENVLNSAYDFVERTKPAQEADYSQSTQDNSLK